MEMAKIDLNRPFVVRKWRLIIICALSFSYQNAYQLILFNLYFVIDTTQAMVLVKLDYVYLARQYVVRFYVCVIIRMLSA